MAVLERQTSELNQRLHEQERQFAAAIKQQNEELEQWKMESTQPLSGPTWTPAAAGDIIKQRMKVTLDYDDSDQTAYPPFESKLKAKLQIDRYVIGNKQEQVWFAFGCLRDKAAT